MTAWTEPPTFTGASVPDEDDFNDGLRDDILHLREQLEWPFGFPVAGEPNGLNSGDPWPLANRCIYERARGSGAITNLGIHVAVSAGNVGLAIYANDGEEEEAAPLTRVGTSGSVACPAGGFASVAVASVTVTAGSHWFALSASSVSAEFAGALWMSLDAIVRGAAAIEDNAHPPPATPATGGHVHPIIGIVGL